MLAKNPEVYVLFFSFLLNLLWESIQAPLFVFEQQSSAFLLTGCLLFCSGVDAFMTLTSYCALSVVARSRYWFLARRLSHWVSFVGIGLVLALASEYTAIHYRNLWEYSSLMPVVPGLNIGLTPLLQWLILPPIVLILLARACGFIRVKSYRKIDAEGE
ncbi:MAG: hypothetical protein IH857_03450 [Deltaproteobacteria bacterium]|nr:hypothetical protein [Deltaproteobacteria bacterium]